MDLNTSDLIFNKHITVTIWARKLKGLGTDILLCMGFIPLSKFLEKPLDSTKMKIMLQTPSDTQQLAVMFLELQKAGFRYDESDPII